MKTPYVIAVFGSSSITQDSQGAQEAERCGRLLAEAGFRVSNGGYTGVMEAASRGAKNAGGYVIGATCDSFANRTPNAYLSEEIPGKDLPERISTLMRISDAYIVLDGNIGTLAELLLAWNIIYMGVEKPLVVVGDALKQAVLSMQEHTEVSDKQMEILTFVPTVEEAVGFIKTKLQAAVS